MTGIRHDLTVTHVARDEWVWTCSCDEFDPQNNPHFSREDAVDAALKHSANPSRYPTS